MVKGVVKGVVNNLVLIQQVSGEGLVGFISTGVACMTVHMGTVHMGTASWHVVRWSVHCRLLMLVVWL